VPVWLWEGHPVNILYNSSFIIKLLLLKNSIIEILYNSILVIIDRFIKYIYFISYIEANGIDKFIYIFIRIVVSNYRKL
jgi:hypothetical protein